MESFSSKWSFYMLWHYAPCKHIVLRFKSLSVAESVQNYIGLADTSNIGEAHKAYRYRFIDSVDDFKARFK